MPRRVTAWACEWGCMKHVDTSKTRMMQHEKACIQNPASRSCPTCIYNDFEAPEPEVGCDGGWFCGMDLLGPGTVLAKGCESWEPAAAPEGGE